MDITVPLSGKEINIVVAALDQIKMPQKCVSGVCVESDSFWYECEACEAAVEIAAIAKVVRQRVVQKYVDGYNESATVSFKTVEREDESGF